MPIGPSSRRTGWRTYLVARLDGRVVGYGGMWVMVDEAHITTFAVDPDFRRQGIGERLLLALLDVATTRRAREATLEVRLSNVAARRLYEKYGFRPVGPPTALLQRRQRGRPDHDDGAAGRHRRCAERIDRLRAALDERDDASDPTGP